MPRSRESESRAGGTIRLACLVLVPIALVSVAAAPGRAQVDGGGAERSEIEGTGSVITVVASGLPRRGSLGPFPLYSEVSDERLLAALDEIASEAVNAYSKLLGVRPEGLEDRSIHLFAQPEAYLAYARGSVPALHTKGGHTSRGAAALVLADRGTREMAPVLIHEIVHLLNEASFGPSRPPWLEEGLANAFAYSLITARNRVRVTSLGGDVGLAGQWQMSRTKDPTERRLLGQLEMSGGAAALRRLVDRAEGDALVPLDTLTRLPWEPFRELSTREDLYIQSGFLLRYLLLGEDGRYAEGVRGYMNALAEGPARMEDHLALEWRGLEGPFRDWLRAEAFGAGIDRRSADAWMAPRASDALTTRRSCQGAGVVAPGSSCN